MKITSYINKLFGCSSNQQQKQVEEKPNPQAFPNLAPLAQDTVTVTSQENPIKPHNRGTNTQKVKKSDFSGLDLATIEKFRVDISKFKTPEDLQNWAKEKIETDYRKRDFGGRQKETQIQRKAMYTEWFHYITKENDAYTPVIQLAILEAVTKDLEQNNDKLPPVLNKGVLADTVCEVLDRLKQNPKEKININKLYQTKLVAASAPIDSDGKPKTDFTGWVMIPSKEHDPEHFMENVDKLKTLSHKTWCTKSFNAEPYLKTGDFHVYLENGQPQIGIRFRYDKIEEIQGPKNNTKIPQAYYELTKNYISENNFGLNNTAEQEMAEAEEVNKIVQKIKKEIGEEAIQNADAEKILPYFGIQVEKDENNLLTISEYPATNAGCSVEDIGVDERKLLKNVKKISHDANFGYKEDIDLSNLEYIGGDANFNGCEIKNLGKLKTIGKKAIFSQAKIENLSNLQSIGGAAFFGGAEIQDLSSLKTIENIGYFSHAQIKSLSNLEYIGGKGIFTCSQVEDLSRLKYIGENADFTGCKVRKLDRLKYVGGNAIFTDSNVESVKRLAHIGKNGYFGRSKVKNSHFILYLLREYFNKENK